MEKYPALRHSDNMWEDCKNGIWTVELNSWQEFEDRIEEFKKYKYLWRGQSCETPPLPTMYRYYEPDDKKMGQHLDEFKRDMPGATALGQFLELAKRKKTTEFEKALSEYYKMIHPKADYDDPKENYVNDFINDIYWAIGQHHGLKTPLLDWTRDPYKALFFAFCARSETDGKRVVFGFAEKARLLMRNKKPKRRHIEFLNNLNFVKTILDSSDSPPHIKERIGFMFRRIERQEGLFTRTLNKGENVEDRARKSYCYYKKERNEAIVFLIKILIPDGLREDILENLKKKKITYKTIYPDLQGAALHCNLKLDGVMNRNNN